jgi:hypothetical protein
MACANIRRLKKDPRQKAYIYRVRYIFLDIIVLDLSESNDKHQRCRKWHETQYAEW